MKLIKEDISIWDMNDLTISSQLRTSASLGYNLIKDWPQGLAITAVVRFRVEVLEKTVYFIDTRK